MKTSRPGFHVVGVVLVVVALLGTSCAMMRQREQIRQGFMTRGLLRDAFLKEWGMPVRTSTSSCGQGSDAQWSGGNGGFGGSFHQGSYVCEVWEYPEHGITLAFNGRQLVGWQTKRTIAELRTR